MMRVQTFKRLSLKNEVPKHAKFSAILEDVKIRRRIFPEQMTILSSRAASYSDRGRYVCMTPELSIYFSRQMRLLSVFFTVRVAFIVDLVVGHVCSTPALCV